MSAAMVDVGLIIGNPFFLATLGLAVIGWIITFAGAAAALTRGLPWFLIFYELFLIIGIAVAITTDSIRYYRLVIVAFLAASVPGLYGLIDGHINSIFSSYQAFAAGSIFLSIVTFIWIFAFGSEEGSLISNTINSFTVNKSTTTTARDSIHPNGGFTNHAPVGPVGPVGLIGPGNIQMMPSPAPDLQNSTTVVVSPNADYAYSAKALYEYQANPDDPNELSFSKGEVLDIVDNKGKWWQARKTDGTIGIAPSNYLQII